MFYMADFREKIEMFLENEPISIYANRKYVQYILILKNPFIVFSRSRNTKKHKENSLKYVL